MTDLIALAGRVEEATGPDRSIDYIVSCWFNRERCDVPAYTSSLDAAMTLAAGQEWCGGAAGLLREAMDRLLWATFPEGVSKADPKAYAETLARFMTAACLRARAAMDKGDGR